MAYRIRVEPHLSVEALYRRYRGSERGLEKTRWQVLWLVSQGRTSQETAAATGCSLNWIRALVGRYNRQGPDGIRDGRSRNRGRAPLLSLAQREELARALQGPAPRGGMWSGPDVAEWMSRTLQRRVGPQRGWVYLRGAGYTPQVPRPRHAGASEEAQEEFQAGASRAGGRRAAGPSGSDP